MQTKFGGYVQNAIGKKGYLTKIAVFPIIRMSIFCNNKNT